jgi:hypothetical protein
MRYGSAQLEFTEKAQCAVLEFFTASQSLYAKTRDSMSEELYNLGS